MEEPELESPPLTQKQREGGLYYVLKKADAVADEVGNDWQREAACTTEDPEFWFPPAKRTREDRANNAKAVQICFTKCPVRLQCLKAACVGKEAAGIWGGLDYTTRRGDGYDHKAHDFEALSKLPNPHE